MVVVIDGKSGDGRIRRIKPLSRNSIEENARSKSLQRRRKKEIQ
jgi:hypothetical protein